MKNLLSFDLRTISIFYTPLVWLCQRTFMMAKRILNITFPIKWSINENIWLMVKICPLSLFSQEWQPIKSFRHSRSFFNDTNEAMCLLSLFYNRKHILFVEKISYFSSLSASLSHSRPHSGQIFFPCRRAPHSHTQSTCRAGTPSISAWGGTSVVTTAPAPIMAHAPTVWPHTMVALAPMDAPSQIRVCL